MAYLFWTYFSVTCLHPEKYDNLIRAFHSYFNDASVKQQEYTLLAKTTDFFRCGRPDHYEMEESFHRHYMRTCSVDEDDEDLSEEFASHYSVRIFSVGEQDEIYSYQECFDIDTTSALNSTFLDHELKTTLTLFLIGQCNTYEVAGVPIAFRDSDIPSIISASHSIQVDVYLVCYFKVGLSKWTHIEFVFNKTYFMRVNLDFFESLDMPIQIEQFGYANLLQECFDYYDDHNFDEGKVYHAI